MDQIGQRLKEERSRLKLTQKNFAAIGGVLANAQSKYERGERSPSAIYLAQLEKIGVDVLYVLTARRDKEIHEGQLSALLKQLSPHERSVITDLIECVVNPKEKH